MSEPKLRRPITLAATVLTVALARPVSAALFWVGVALAAAGASLRLWAAGHIEKNRRLTTHGPYALVRHPLYLGSWLLLAGVCVAAVDPSGWPGSIAAPAAAAAGFGWLYAQEIRFEEADLERIYGPAHAEYAAAVPRVLPAPSRLAEAVGSSRWRWPQVRANRELATLTAAAIVVAALRMKMVGR